MRVSDSRSATEGITRSGHAFKPRVVVNGCARSRGARKTRENGAGNLYTRSRGRLNGCCEPWCLQVALRAERTRRIRVRAGCHARRSPARRPAAESGGFWYLTGNADVGRPLDLVGGQARSSADRADAG
jgi:hypothetical protein